MKPIGLREVEERIRTIDGQGNPRTVIRTRTLASFQGPTGIVEVEQARRHTLPGFGHVYPIAEHEYVVFRDQMKLHAEPQMAKSSALRVTTSVPPHVEQDIDCPAMSAGPSMALQAQVGARRGTFAVVAGLGGILVTLALSTLPPQPEYSPSFGSIAPATPYIGTVVMLNESALAAFPTTLSHEAQPMESPKEASLARKKRILAPAGFARVELAIRPWGTVYVNGKKRGASPPVRELKLKPGRYTVEVRNDASLPYRVTLDVRTKATARVAHDFMKTESAAADKPDLSLASVARPHARLLSDEWPR